MGNNCEASKMLQYDILRKLDVVAHLATLPAGCRAEIMRQIEEKVRIYRAELENQRTDDCLCVLSRYTKV
jgi:hypothetical protein